MPEFSIAKYHHQFAKEFVSIGDFSAPAFYQSPAEEFAAALQGPVVMDRSFLGLARVFGKDAGSLLHGLTTNEMRSLQTGQSLVNIFTTAKGRILDVVEMLRREEDYLLITSPERAATVLQWIDKYTFVEEVRSENLTSRYALFSLFGKIQNGFAGLSLHHLLPQHFREMQIAGVEVIVQRTKGIAPDGYNFLVKVEAAAAVWEFLRHHAKPIGFVAYDTLRVHVGIPAAGAEITEEQNPHEVNLLPFINFEKGCYIGQEVIARLDTYDKVQRQLVGLEFESDHLPALNCSLWAGNEEAGVLTSAVFSPIRQKAIGLGLVRRKFVELGQRFTARSEDASWPCTMVALPFAHHV